MIAEEVEEVEFLPRLMLALPHLNNKLPRSHFLPIRRARHRLTSLGFVPAPNQLRQAAVAGVREGQGRGQAALRLRFRCHLASMQAAGR